MVRRKLWPAAALLAAALAGCSGGSGGTAQPGASSPASAAAASEPSAAPTPSVTVTASPTATATATGPSRTPTPASSFAGLEMAKSGGFAGVSESVSIKADGSWTRFDDRKVVRTGKLTGAQVAKLQKLATDPQLKAEADRKVASNRCADGFLYTLHVDYQLIRYEQCGANDKPKVTLEIINYVEDVT